MAGDSLVDHCNFTDICLGSAKAQLLHEAERGIGMACVVLGPARLRYPPARSVLRRTGRSSRKAANHVTFHVKPPIRWRRRGYFRYPVTMGKKPCKDTRVVKKRWFNSWILRWALQHMPEDTECSTMRRLECRTHYLCVLTENLILRKAVLRTIIDCVGVRRRVLSS